MSTGLEIEVEGQGSGIKTVIVNMVDVANRLQVNPAYITKFFGIELGALSKYDIETACAVVQGKHSQSDLTSLLDKFTESFVLCPNCDRLELDMSVKQGTVTVDCRACGYGGTLEPTVHKLITYITKYQ